ncbi:MAG: tRNA pseudouridine(38-40) synthase TruA [Acidobacteriota bacterium]
MESEHQPTAQDLPPEEGVRGETEEAQEETQQVQQREHLPAVHQVVLAYQGARYAGWQRQDNAVAVQQVVEEALEEILPPQFIGRGPVRVVAASRTDAGVHALGQSAHLRLRKPFPGNLAKALNGLLPRDIRILKIAAQSADFSAQRCTIGKIYSYRVTTDPVPSPLLLQHAAPSRDLLDLGLLRRAAALVVGSHDFTAFALRRGNHRQPVRTVYRCGWQQTGPGELRLVIVGNGFLRGMVRTLAGTFLEVGSGRRSLESLRRLLRGAPRPQAGPTAPAQGLTLERVLYPSPWGTDACPGSAAEDFLRHSRSPWERST